MNVQLIRFMMSQKSYPFINFMVIFVGVLGLFATDIYVPAIPTITHALNTTPSIVKLSLTLYLLGFSISPLIFGAWSDKYGRKPLFLTFAFIGLVGIIIAACAVNIEMIIIGRLIQGIGFGISTSISRTILVDLYKGPKLNQMASLISFWVAMGPALAPILGSYIQHYLGWRWIFIFLFIYLVIGILLCLYKLPETLQEKNHHSTKAAVILKNYKLLLSNKFFMGYVFCSSMAVAGIIIFFSLSPFILQHQYHLSVVQYGWATGAITLMVIVSRIINIPLVKRMASEKVVALGLAVMFLSSAILTILTLLHLVTLASIIICMMFFILGSGGVMPNSTANALSIFKHIGGMAGALYGSLQMFGAFLAGLLASFVPNTVLVLALLLCFAMLIALIAFVSIHFKRNKVSTV